MLKASKIPGRGSTLLGHRLPFPHWKLLIIMHDHFQGRFKEISALIADEGRTESSFPLPSMSGCFSMFLLAHFA